VPGYFPSFPEANENVPGVLSRRLEFDVFLALNGQIKNPFVRTRQPFSAPDQFVRKAARDIKPFALEKLHNLGKRLGVELGWFWLSWTANLNLGLAGSVFALHSAKATG
jgi:hypothetical protein